MVLLLVPLAAMSQKPHETVLCVAPLGTKPDPVIHDRDREQAAARRLFRSGGRNRPAARVLRAFSATPARCSSRTAFVGQHRHKGREWRDILFAGEAWGGGAGVRGNTGSAEAGCVARGRGASCRCVVRGVPMDPANVSLTPASKVRLERPDEGSTLPAEGVHRSMSSA